MQLTPLPATGLYTAGYQGRTPEAFVRLVEKHDTRQVIDVRERLVSRRPGFGKGALIKVLDAAGVKYAARHPIHGTAKRPFLSSVIIRECCSPCL